MILSLGPAFYASLMPMGIMYIFVGRHGNRLVDRSMQQEAPPAGHGPDDSNHSVLGVARLVGSAIIVAGFLVLLGLLGAALAGLGVTATLVILSVCLALPLPVLIWAGLRAMKHNKAPEDSLASTAS